MSGLVVKDNALIQASYSLSLGEQRLILLAIIQARQSQQGLSSDTLLQLHASSYSKQFNITNDMAYVAMRESSEGLFNRYVVYHDKNPKTGRDRSFKGRWVDKIGYEKGSGYVYVRFSSEVIPLITRLEEQFTSYEIEQVAKLTSGYAIRLYELLIQWRSTGKTPVFELEDFRLQLGVGKDKHKQMSNFKAYVMDTAIEQINKYTDITVKYQQQKKGRKIVGFKFLFKVKSKPKEKTVNEKRDPNTIDWIDGVTDNEIKGMNAAQANKYANLLRNNHDIVGKWSDCRSYDEAQAKLCQQLQDPQYVRKYMKHLLALPYPHKFDPKTLGFKS